MIGAIVIFIGLIAAVALVFAYIHWLDEAKKSGIVNHDYNNEEDNNDDRA